MTTQTQPININESKLIDQISEYLLSRSEDLTIKRVVNSTVIAYNSRNNKVYILSVTKYGNVKKNSIRAA